MRVLSIAFVLCTLFFLAACQSATTLTPESPDPALVQKITEQQQCARITCPQNYACKMGVCVCAPSFKKCGDSCILAVGCCMPDDCDDDHVCSSDNRCHKKPRVCDYFQQWNAETETCTCVSGTTFCEQQNKCIPEKNCCTPSDCTLRRDLCVPTTNFAILCINDPALHCKGIPEGHQALFNLPRQEFMISVTNIIEQGTSLFTLNKEAIKLPLNTSYIIDDQTMLSIQEVKTVGGVCKTYHD